MKYFIILNFFIFSFLNFSCKVKSKNDLTRDFKTFNRDVNVKFNKVLYFGNEGLPRKLYLTDSTIIIKGSNTKSNYNFYEYNLNDTTLKNMYFKTGRFKGQTLGPLSSGLFNNLLWVNDITLGKFILLNLKTKEIQEYPIEKFFFSVDYLGNNEILTTGDDSTNYKISIYNLINKNIVKEFGVYDNIPNNIPFNSWRLGNEGFVFHNKISKKAIIALRYSDKIDFFSNLDSINYTLFGPERFEPEFKITKGYKDSDIIQRNEKTRFAYLSGVTTDKYIYLLYSGNQHESKNKDYGKTIFVFDWDGKPILRINLPVYVSGFTVSKTDEQIFVSEPINKTIYSFKINL